MKTYHSFLPAGALAAFMIGLLLAASPMATAQTYYGQSQLTEVPNQLEANVYPLSNRTAALQVIFNNRSGGEVHILIRSTQGKVYYNELDYTALYRRCFNLSDLPVGQYTLELSHQQTHVVRSFAINSPVDDRLLTMDVDSPDSTGKRLTIR